jgi:hypothetical protein
MQVPENDVTWTFSLLAASESRASSRTGTPDGFVSELVGIDGTNNGGLVPFPGFREMYRFTPDESASGTTMTYGGVAWSTGTNPYVAGTTAHKCRVVDFWSFSVVAGANTRVWGFVYVVRRASVITGSPSCNNTYDLMMAFNAPNGSTVPQFRTVLLQQGMTDGGVLADQGNAVMSVETTSKAVYVFRRGVAPIAVYFKIASSSSTIATVVDPAGPGKRIAARPFTNTASPPVEVDFPTAAVDAHDATWFLDPTNSANSPGSVVFCRIASGTTPAAGSTGGGPYVVSNLSTAPVLKSGSYSFAVQFEDSRSGRKSQISNNVDMTTTSDLQFFVDGVYDSLRFDTLNIYRSVRTDSAAGAYTNGILQLDAQVTLSSYEVSTLPIRSGTLPSTTGVKFFRYAYQLKDAALVMQDVFLDKPSYSETMPKGGAGAMFDGTMLVGNISEGASDLTGTGETRWSASGTDSPELFTALGQYKPSSVGDAVTCFKRTGQVMAGLTRSGVQFFSKQDGFIRVLAAHQGYGVTGPYAAATVGPVTYYLNYRGLKAIFPDGRLDDAQAINQLVSSDWYSGTTGAQELSDVSMAFDPATLCLYILNPARKQAVQMWFATGVMSELEDMSFSKVTPGWWQDTDGGTNKNQLVPRALFLQNAPIPDLVTNTSYRPGVFMPSRSYSDKTDGEAGASQVSMFDGKMNRNPSTQITSGQASQTTGSYYDNTCTLQTSYPTWTISVNPFGSVDSTRMIGMWVYILWPFESSTRPSKFQVLNATSSTLLLTRPTYPTSDPLVIGEYISPVAKTLVMDPVYVRVVTGALRMSEDKAEEFVIKQPTSMGVVLSDVNLYDPGEGNPGAPQSWYWVGSLFRANESLPLAWSAPVAPDGTYVQYSITNGDSPNWALFKKHSYLGQWFFPAFETFVPNVQYRLLGLQVKGRMLPTDRTRRTY